MSRRKRASMREGPLSDLFRGTSEEGAGRGERIRPRLRPRRKGTALVGAGPTSTAPAGGAEATLRRPSESRPRRPRRKS